MADPFDTAPNFINPQYATPEQIATLRQYGAQLLQPQPVQHWAQGLANVVRALMGGYEQHKADLLQQQAIGQATQQRMANPIFQDQTQQPSGQMSGQPRGIRNNNPGNIEDGDFAKAQAGYQGTDGRFAQFDTPEHGQQAMDKLLQSYGQRGINTTAGVIGRWAPPNENNTTAYTAAVAKQLGVDPNAPLDMTNPAVRQQLSQGITGYENGPRYAQASPQSQPGQVNPAAYAAYQQNPWANKDEQGYVRGLVAPQATKDIYGRPLYTSPMGSANAPVGYQPGAMGSVGVTPEGGVSAPMVLSPGQQSGDFRSTIGPAFSAAQDFAAQASKNKTIRGQQTSDVENAFSSIPIRQTLQAMKDDIVAHGDKMPWGPSADWINNLKKNIAQFAPGLLSKSDIEGLASADSFEKLSSQLQSMVGRQVGSTDASLLQGIKSVPGSHNSKEGALALIDMLDQVYGLNSQFVQQNQFKIGQPGFDYLTEKNRFFDQHPLVNPITHNPIRLDLENKNQNAGTYTGGWRIVR